MDKLMSQNSQFDIRNLDQLRQMGIKKRVIHQPLYERQQQQTLQAAARNLKPCYKWMKSMRKQTAHCR